MELVFDLGSDVGEHTLLPSSKWFLFRSPFNLRSSARARKSSRFSWRGSPQRRTWSSRSPPSWRSRGEDGCSSRECPGRRDWWRQGPSCVPSLVPHLHRPGSHLRSCFLLSDLRMRWLYSPGNRSTLGWTFGPFCFSKSGFAFFWYFLMVVIRSRDYSWWRHNEMSKCARVQIPFPTQFQPGNLTSKMLPRPKLILTAMTGARLGKEIRRISYLPWHFGARWCLGEVDFPANVVHFELVCSNHKFRICQIAIVKCSIKVCIQQMLHGLQKQYRSVLPKVQESYHFFFIKTSFFYQTTGLTKTFSVTRFPLTQ